VISENPLKLRGEGGGAESFVTPFVLLVLSLAIDGRGYARWRQRCSLSVERPLSLAVVRPCRRTFARRQGSAERSSRSSRRRRREVPRRDVPSVSGRSGRRSQPRTVPHGVGQRPLDGGASRQLSSSSIVQKPGSGMRLRWSETCEPFSCSGGRRDPPDRGRGVGRLDLRDRR